MQLQVATGKVRCGHCHTVFNAAEQIATETDTTPQAVNLPPEADITVVGDIEIPEIEMPVIETSELEETISGLENNETQNIAATASDAPESAAALQTQAHTDTHTPSPAAAPGTGHEDVQAIPESAAEQASVAGEAAPSTRAGQDVPAVDAAPRAAQAAGYDISKLYPELHGGQHRTPGDVTPRYMLVLWGTLIIALLLVFMTQATHLLRDDLMKYPSLRPWMVRFCQLTDCELKMRRDSQRLDILQREVLSHPAVNNALLVKATIVNRADFYQPYPDIRLTFRDLRDRHVASRVFHPADYLPGDIVVNNGLAPDTPTNVTLEIVDPGENAVSFVFDLL
jgi:hypothetical protein